MGVQRVHQRVEHHQRVDQQQRRVNEWVGVNVGVNERVAGHQWVDPVAVVEGHQWVDVLGRLYTWELWA